MSGKVLIWLCSLLFFVLAHSLYANAWDLLYWHGFGPHAATALVLALLLALAGIGLWLERRWAPPLALLAWLLPLLATIVPWNRYPYQVAVLRMALPDTVLAGLFYSTPLLLPILWYARRRFRAPPPPSDVPARSLWWRGLVSLTVCLVLLLPVWSMRPSGIATSIREGSTAGRPVRILFIGNSLVYSNDMPAMLMALADADRRPICTGMVVGGGYTLHLHAARDTAAEVIAQQGPWDFVVLQEQSETPLWFPGETLRSLQTLEPAISQAGARAVLLDTGPRDERIRLSRIQTLASGGREFSMPVVPVTILAEKVAGRLPDLALVDADGQHPSPAGSYLMACALYAALLERSPQGLPATLRDGDGRVVLDLPAEQAQQIQTLAWQVVQGRQQSQVASLDAEVGPLLFFESGEEPVPVTKRAYAQRFRQGETRYVSWELNLDHTPPDQRRDFSIEAIYYRADDSIFGQQTVSSWLEPGWFDSFHYARWGWSEPGRWPVGTYRVELQINGQKAASRSFEIYQD